DNNRILPLLYRALDRVKYNKENEISQETTSTKLDSNLLLGKSPIFEQALQLAQKVAPTNATVLLTGETGTGKEVFATAIHQSSLRKNQNFVAINCSAFSKDLLESELFGHKAGAFTGAMKDQKGLFEEAHLGTIFLDEIGEMALDLQAKLLRVLESGEFIKIGETKPTKVDVRIIAATNRNLEKEIANGTFREDLFYRISVFHIELPSLRERVSDIELIVNQFIKHFNQYYQKNIKSINQEALLFLKKYSWPGNIRELKNTIERAIILSENEELSTNDFPSFIQTSEIDQNENSLELALMEKKHIQKVLKFTKGNKTKTAELLGIGLTTLYRKIAEYELN
ncbi:sigma-54 dependent transcriptional regulator, partial [Empedobacter sp.]